MLNEMNQYKMIIVSVLIDGVCVPQPYIVRISKPVKHGQMFICEDLEPIKVVDGLLQVEVADLGGLALPPPNEVVNDGGQAPHSGQLIVWNTWKWEGYVVLNVNDTDTKRFRSAQQFAN